MRSELVVTNETCNQNCGYCTARRGAEDRAFVAPAAVRARIEQALARAPGETELVLGGGGEPTLRRDLPALVAHARARGAARVALETNAALIAPPLARALRDAGLALARVNLAGWGDALDAVTRDPGGFARTLAGLRALLDAGVDVEVACALTRATRPLLGALPAGLADALPRGDAPDRGRVLGLLAAVPVESPDSSELLDYEEASAALLALDAAARAVGLPVRLRPDAGLPPCVMPLGPRTAHLFALTPGGARRPGFSQLAPCAACAVRDRCPGLSDKSLARFGPPRAMTPVTEERTRRRLSLMGSVREQIAREIVQRNDARGPDGSHVEECIVRVNFHCNQSCRFCFVSTHLPPPDDAAVRAAIVAAGERGAKVVLSGGEPTLNPRLPEYVALARAHSRFPVHLQTNATRLDDRALTAALVDAGLGEVSVSLHGSTAELSDAVTEAPGTFARTVAGLDALAAEPRVQLALNFVIHQRNAHDLPAFVALCAARWPRAWVNFAFVAPSSDVVPRDPGMIPRYTDVLPHIATALAEAQRHGIAVTGFDSMCGIPLCLVPDEVRPGFFAFAELAGVPDGGEFVRAPACGQCALAAKCFGVRRGYAALHGLEEMHAVTAGP